jgi:hypothetical protein
MKHLLSPFVERVREASCLRDRALISPQRVHAADALWEFAAPWTVERNEARTAPTMPINHPAIV